MEELKKILLEIDDIDKILRHLDIIVDNIENKILKCKKEQWIYCSFFIFSSSIILFIVSFIV